MMQAPLVAAADHAGKVAAPESFLSTELDIIGRFIVHNLNGTTFGILTLIALAGMIWYRNKRGLPVHRSHCFRLIAGALEVYLAVTLWAVFALTHPPAFELIGTELLPYVGLVTLVVMCSSGLVSLKFAFRGSAKAEADSETASDADIELPTVPDS
jgi:hypothetical protein